MDDGAEYDQNFDDLLHILTQAISWYYVSHSLHNMSDTSDFNEKDLYFTTFISLARGLTQKQLEAVHENQLDDLLKSWRLRRVPVPGDGNCLFTSVAESRHNHS